MHIEIVPNRNSRPAVLLRESFREGPHVRKRTLANLSSLPSEQIEAIRRILKGEILFPMGDWFEIIESAHHGHVRAVLAMMKRLGIADLLATRDSKERAVALAMIAARVLLPHSKLATTRAWHATTLPERLSVEGADEDDLYAAMDWLLERQPRIEKKLAGRHLEQGGLVLYDLSSSYVEGTHCALAKLGHNRDGKKGKLQINYGLLTDRRGCPVAVSVFEGNTNDSKTLLPQVDRVRKDFGIEDVVLVGDRGMLSQTQIRELKKIQGVAWITALRTKAIRGLVEGGAIQLDLFDERNLFELQHPDYPGERLVACRNPSLATMRAAKRQDLLAATARELEKVRGMVGRGRLVGRDKIGVRVGRVVNKYKVAKHFDLVIGNDRFEFQIAVERVSSEAALDGIYVIRTSVPADRLDAEDAVRNYKSLSQVERAFRSLKSVDLRVRPIHHYDENRVRAHIFLCMLAAYVQWHLVAAWRSLLFNDEDLAAKAVRDPVAPAERSTAAAEKAARKKLPDDTDVHSLGTLLRHLSTIVVNTCRRKGAAEGEATFRIETTPNAKQQRAFDLIAGAEL